VTEKQANAGRSWPNGLRLSGARMGSLTAKFYAPSGTWFCCGAYLDSTGSRKASPARLVRGTGI